MLQRSLIRQSRTLQSCIRQSRSISNSYPVNSRPLGSLKAKAPILSASTRIPRRWVSTDVEQKTLGDQEAAAATNSSSDPQSKEASTEAENPLQKELEAKNREVIDLKDKYLRSVADFRNLQERTKRDVDNARNFAIQRFANDLLESIDNLDRALGSVPAPSSTESDPSKDLPNLHSGLQMTSQILMSTLSKHGLERFDPMEAGKERKFDPKLDEAVFMSPMQGKDNGDVMHTQSKGFLLNGRVLRAAKVGVVKNS